MSQNTEPHVEKIDAMFVQIARGMSSSYRSLTLHGLSPLTLFVSGGPQRVVGQLQTKEFVDQWGEGENSFADDPPNAVVAFLGEGDTVPQEAVVVLNYPQLDGDTLSYTVDVLDGDLPARAGSCSLFIDPIGRPLTPRSVAAVRRRERRRMYRRM